jgi:hypothetical protein
MVSPRMRSVDGRWLRAIGVIALLGPCLVALYLECTSGAVHALPDGDEAVIETRLLTLTKAFPLVGPYSRFGWNHPGPLLFLVLAPSYFMSGKASVAIAITAALLNLSALAASVWLFWRAIEDTWPRLVTLILLAVFLSYFGAVFLPTSYTTAWNPVITVLPYGLLLLLCAGLACGNPRYLIAAVIVHAFIAQSHVAYALSGTVALGAAVALAVVEPRRSGTGRGEGRAWWVAGGLTSAVLWAPTCVDAFFGSGNLQLIVRFFGRARKVFTVRPGPAFELVAWRAFAPWRALAGDPSPDRPSEAGVWAVGLLIVTLGSLLVASARARRTGRQHLCALCLLLFVQFVVAWLSMLRIDTPDQPYLTWWIALLGTWSWVAIAGALLSGTGSAVRSWKSMLAPAGAVVLVGALSCRSMRGSYSEYERFARDVQVQRGPTIELAKSLEPLFRCAPALGIAIRRHELWGTVAGVLIKLDKVGIWPVLEPSWRFMFGPGYVYEQAPARALAFYDRFEHDAHLLRAAPNLYVYTSEREDPLSAPVVRPISVVASEGVRGNVAGLVDGQTPVEGAHWDSPGTVILDTPTSSVTLALPSRDLTEIWVTADGNDSYTLQGSTDGARFVAAGVIANANLFGLRTRHVKFAHPRAWSYLRIRPQTGDGLYSLRQITAFLGDWAVQPIDESFTTFALPEVSVDGVRIAADCKQAYGVEGSLDGRSFLPLGRVAIGDTSECRSRVFYFNDAELWRRIRLSRDLATGADAIVEVRPVVAPGEFFDVSGLAARPRFLRGWSASERDGSGSWVWATDDSAQMVPGSAPGPGWELLLSLSPSPETRSAEVYWDGLRIGQFALEPGAHTYRAPIPSTGTRDGLVELRLARPSSSRSVGGSQDARTLAALYGVELRPRTPSLQSCDDLR